MAEQFNLAIPANIPINGFGRGRRIRIVGVPDGNADRFTVNLKTPSDIALHFDARFSISHIGISYGDFPFYHGRIFTLEFIAAGGEIHVLYNGRFMIRFEERDDPLNIKTVNIEGNVHIHSVHISN